MNSFVEIMRHDHITLHIYVSEPENNFLQITILMRNLNEDFLSNLLRLKFQILALIIFACRIQLALK